MRYNTALTQDNRRTITMPQEVGPMLYHTSIIFNSLDKSRDEGDYECNVDVMIERENSQLRIMNSASKTMVVPSECHLNKLYTMFLYPFATYYHHYKWQMSLTSINTRRK